MAWRVPIPVHCGTMTENKLCRGAANREVSIAADALEAIVDLDLPPLADIDPPRGYGRD
jgi:hypothetical protein